MISFSGVSKAFDGREVLREIDWEIEPDCPVAVLGNSGSGKTTLLNLLTGLIKPDKGSITGTKGLLASMVFQEDRLLPWLTARQNIDVVAQKGRTRSEELLTALELSQDGDKYPEELSGGMKRRVAVARALNFESGLLLLDEPFKGLDRDLKQKAMELVASRLKGRCFVLVTHDHEEADFLSERQYTIQEKKLVQV